MESRGSIKQSASIKGEDGIVNIGSCSHPGQESSTTNAEKTSTIIDGTLPVNLVSLSLYPREDRPLSRIGPSLDPKRSECQNMMLQHDYTNCWPTRSEMEFPRILPWHSRGAWTVHLWHRPLWRTVSDQS